MKKLFTFIITALVANFFVMTLGPVFAINEEDTLKGATFDVQEYLNLNEDQQKADYFDEKANPAYANYSPIVRLILIMLDTATKIIGSLAMILLIIAGLMMMFSQGNTEAVDKAKAVFKYVIIGLMLTFFSYIIVIFIQSVLQPSVQ